MTANKLERIKKFCYRNVLKKYDFRMNDILIELCEREGYERTIKILEKKFGKRISKRRLRSFIKFIKHESDKNKENAKPKSKLSFDVSINVFYH